MGILIASIIIVVGAYLILDRAKFTDNAISAQRKWLGKKNGNTAMAQWYVVATGLLLIAGGAFEIIKIIVNQ
jgi:hypothetical protein